MIHCRIRVMLWTEYVVVYKGLTSFGCCYLRPQLAIATTLRHRSNDDNVSSHDANNINDTFARHSNASENIAFLADRIVTQSSAICITMSSVSPSVCL